MTDTNSVIKREVGEPFDPNKFSRRLFAGLLLVTAIVVAVMALFVGAFPQ